MINLEIAITLVTMLVAFFIVIYLFRKGHVRTKRVKQDFETLELAKQLKCDTRESENLTALGLKPLHIKTEKTSAIDTECKSVIAFGFIILSAYLAWSAYLMSRHFIEIAVLSIVFALASVLLLIYAKRNILKGKTEISQLRSAVDEHEQGDTTAPAAKIVKPVVAKQATTPAKQSVSMTAIPEDSMLRRHFLTQLRTKIEAELPPRPTDFNLLRHYKAMVQAELERELEKHYL